MSFAPILGPESPTHAYIQSLVTKYFASLAALTSSLLATMFASIDNLAMRISPSCCLVCYIKDTIKIFLEYFFPEKQIVTTELPITALAFDPGTEVYTLKKLEDIDVEKAIYRDFPPSSAHSIKVQLLGEIEPPAEVHLNDVHNPRRLKHKRSLAHGFYIMPGRAGTQTTITPKDAQEDQLAELPAPGFFSQRKYPVELPADEISPVIAPPVPPTPLLLPPRPRSANSRKASPLLAPLPPGAGFSDKRTSYGSSVGSASIQIAYVPSHRDDGEGEKADASPALDRNH